MSDQAHKNAAPALIKVTNFYQSDPMAVTLALMSGIAILAIPFLELGFTTSFFLEEAARPLLDTATTRQKKMSGEQKEVYSSLIKERATKTINYLQSKSIDTFTDRDRIKLALLADWGILDQAQIKISPALEVEALTTQLTIACRMNGLTSVKIAEMFTFPRLCQKEYSTQEKLDILHQDKQRFLAFKQAQKQNGLSDFSMRLLQDLSLAAIEATMPSIGLISTLLIKGSMLSSAFNAATIRPPRKSDTHPLESFCASLLTDYRDGINDIRRASRRAMRQAGIPFESVMVKTPEGELRHVVRPSQPKTAPTRIKLQ